MSQCDYPRSPDQQDHLGRKALLAHKDLRDSKDYKDLRGRQDLLAR